MQNEHGTGPRRPPETDSDVAMSPGQANTTHRHFGDDISQRQCRDRRDCRWAVVIVVVVIVVSSYHGCAHARGTTSTVRRLHLHLGTLRGPPSCLPLQMPTSSHETTALRLGSHYQPEAASFTSPPVSPDRHRRGPETLLGPPVPHRIPSCDPPN